MNPPTIYDVARIAGVSTATVSKVINNTGRISAKTTEKVTRIMEELNFRPNMIASAMKGKSTYQIAFLIPDISNPVYSLYLKHIEERGQERGYNIVLCATDNRSDKEERHVSILKQRRIDGLIIASKFQNEELLAQLVREKFPVVLLAHERPEVEIDSVTVDDYRGGYMAASHLLSLGHAAIGLIGEDSFSSRERIRGYKQAMSEAGIPCDESLIAVGGPSIAEAELAAAKLLDRDDRPGAIFGCNDLLAIGVLQAASKRGIEVPRQLSVIGFDDTPLCTIVSPGLTSVSQPIRELGTEIMDLLIRKIEQAGLPKQRIRMQPGISIRETTARFDG
ncbi:LacI family DNA-binding transcriptional regulator [Paenibacillus humicola]|uniref:LacI family DNA-binding transcriptional regulator n=1 Tax=Paenibacillus humicola TaxID=3110540 RepID=UPI00237A2F40|nr:LacI family DNA-binding transcriptional regulator [Paenibacillus humicola]